MTNVASQAHVFLTQLHHLSPNHTKVEQSQQGIEAESLDCGISDKKKTPATQYSKRKPSPTTLSLSPSLIMLSHKNAISEQGTKVEEFLFDVTKR